MLLDLRHAVRQLWRAPAFSLVVMLTLGLGIGAITAIFTLVNAVLLRPLAYPAAERIMTVWSYSARRSNAYPVSGPDYQDWRNLSRSFVAMASYRPDQTGVVVGQAARTVPFAHVSADFFRVLGAEPRLGRLFSPDEMRTGGVVVVSEAFARRHFGGALEPALGASLKLFGRSFVVVGVMPAQLAFPAGSELWTPVDTILPANTNRTSHNYRVLARLRPGITQAQAQGEMDGIASALAAQHPGSNKTKGARLISLPQLLVDRYETTLWILLAAVGLVLLIACANIANLLLARGVRRLHEMAVRSALGAGRGRITRQLLTETLLLAGLGGALGVLAASWGLDGLLALAPAGIPRLDHVVVDRQALGFAALVSLLVCVVTGLFPVLQATRVDLAQALRAAGRGSTGPRGRLRSALVVTQLAVCLVVLSGAGLLLRSFHNLATHDPGYRVEDLLVMEANHSTVGEANARRAVGFFEETRRRAAAMPGISAASFTGSLPLEEAGSNGTYRIEGRPLAGPDDSLKHNAQWRVVGPDYFSTLGIRVREGRAIEVRDSFEATPVVVINEALAQAAFPGPSALALGRRIGIGWDRGDQHLLTIVGVVADTPRSAPGPQAQAQELYVPAAQHPRIATVMKIVARTALEPSTLAAGLRNIAQQLDREVPVKVTTAASLVDETLAAPRFRGLLMGLFALAALLLALVGVAGVMACVVAERRREIGVRLAIGARPSHIARQFIAQALRLALLGLGVGFVLALLAARALRGLLYGVSGTDPVILAGVAALLVIAAVAAAAWPAWRAARISPLTALRSD